MVVGGSVDTTSTVGRVAPDFGVALYTRGRSLARVVVAIAS